MLIHFPVLHHQVENPQVSPFQTQKVKTTDTVGHLYLGVNAKHQPVFSKDQLENAEQKIQVFHKEFSLTTS